MLKAVEVRDLGFGVEGLGPFCLGFNGFGVRVQGFRCLRKEDMSGAKVCIM